MKLKLTGLLLLSQAANSLTIDKTNYQQHLCDETSFNPAGVISGTTLRSLVDSEKQSIVSVHSQYCKAKFLYEQAVEKEKIAGWVANMECGGRKPRERNVALTPSQCKEKQGILYAKACDDLMNKKEKMSQAWRDVSPELASCTNSL